MWILSSVFVGVALATYIGLIGRIKKTLAKEPAKKQ